MTKFLVALGCFSAVVFGLPGPGEAFEFLRLIHEPADVKIRMAERALNRDQRCYGRFYFPVASFKPTPYYTYRVDDRACVQFQAPEGQVDYNIVGKLFETEADCQLKCISLEGINVTSNSPYRRDARCYTDIDFAPVQYRESPFYTYDVDYHICVPFRSPNGELIPEYQAYVFKSMQECEAECVAPVKPRQPYLQAVFAPQRHQNLV